MPIQVISEESASGIAIDANGICPIPGSKCLRTIDVLDICKNATRINSRNKDMDRDLVQITYGEIPNAEGVVQRCIRIIYFIGEYTQFGEKHLLLYPEHADMWMFADWFEASERADFLGCNPEEMGQTIIEYAPWQ